MATADSDDSETNDTGLLSTTFRAIGARYDRSEGGFTTEQLRSLQRKTQTEARIIERGGSQ
jgi:hypothetical protein